MKHMGRTKTFPKPTKNARIQCVKKVLKFFKEARAELKRVEWPTRKETLRLTGYVIGVSFGIGLFVMLTDYLFKELLTVVITKQ
jgi:preprotein translocase subunit SecE